MAISTVLLVEDDPYTRAHLARAIEANARLRLIGQAANCAEARELLARRRPDVLLTDLGLPDGHGIDLIRTARKMHPDTLIMVVTVFGDEQNVVRSLAAGASSYLLKDGSLEEIGEAIDELVGGGSPVSAPIARYLLKHFHANRSAAPPSKGSEVDAEVPKLSGRETEALELIAKGFSYAEIGDLLGISVHTVNTHVRHIYKKLHVSSRSEAVYEAVNLGLIRFDR